MIQKIGLEFPFLGENQKLNSDGRLKLPGRFTLLEDGFTHYEVNGPEDGKRIVLVHGFSVPYFIWDPTFEFLAQAGYRVLRYDLFGRGFSDRPRTNYDEKLFERQLVGLLDSLGWNSAVNVFGLSMGAIIAANLANDYPGRVDKLVFIDPAGFELDFPLIVRVILLPGFGEVLFSLLGSGVLLRSMASYIYDPRLVDRFLERYKLQMVYKGFKRAILSTMRSDILGYQEDLYRSTGLKIRDILLIWGKEDKIVPFRHSQTLLEIIPHVQFHPIDDVGHIPHYEKAEVVNQILQDFLEV
jgi:pimeloyl-ACP methyl ester carboxylesterase